VPDATPPAIFNIQIAGPSACPGGNDYFIDDAGNPSGTPSQATISAAVTDTGGSGLNKTTVTFHYWDTLGTRHDIQMGYSLITHRFASLVTSNVSWPPGEIVYWITASDYAGNSAGTSAPPAGGPYLYKGGCIV
jgi:hypothetical protein